MDKAEYRYMTKIVREMNKYKELREKGNKLNPSEEVLLHLIRHHEGISQKELVVLRNVDKAAVARELSKLELKGYIERKSGEDLRTRLIYSTEKTKNLKQELVSYEEEFFEWLFSSIESKEKEKFFETLTVLYLRSKQESRNGFTQLLEMNKNEK
ncbi:MAG: MarR family transcriptional regulator [Bulleidia sp.]|nr:MarR family transcriptional regulator [Bulleidia sp.]